MWKAAAQASLLIQLWGTICCGLCMVSDVSVIAAHRAYAGHSPPSWLDRRVVTSTLAFLVLFPLCLQRHIRQVGPGRGWQGWSACCAGGCAYHGMRARQERFSLEDLSAPLTLALHPPGWICTTSLSRWQLETVAAAGMALILGLVVLLAVVATTKGFPGISSGDVPVWGVRLDGNLPEAFAVLGALCCCSTPTPGLHSATMLAS